MPRPSVWMIRVSLVYLVAGFTIGGLLLFHKGLPFDTLALPGLGPRLWTLLPAHIEFLLGGWVIQLAMGVAYWILPRFSRQPRRGNPVLIWSAFSLLNTGVLLVGLGPSLNVTPQLIIFGRIAQAGSAVVFAAHAWPRVKAAGAP